MPTLYVAAADGRLLEDLGEHEQIEDLHGQELAKCRSRNHRVAAAKQSWAARAKAGGTPTSELEPLQLVVLGGAK